MYSLGEVMPITELFGLPTPVARRAIASGTLGTDCPFFDQTCTKTGKGKYNPTGICSIGRGKPRQNYIVCPKRFYEDNFRVLSEISRLSFKETPDTEVYRIGDVPIYGAGKVDWILVQSEGNHILDFVGVEVQAVDITGTVSNVHEAILEQRSPLPKDRYGLNFANVAKRLISQLVEKGRYFNSWGVPVFVVLQDLIFERIVERYGATDLGEEPEGRPGPGIVFVVCKFEIDDATEMFKVMPDKIWAMSYEKFVTQFSGKALVPRKDDFMSELSKQLARR